MFHGEFTPRDSSKDKDLFEERDKMEKLLKIEKDVERKNKYKNWRQNEKCKM